MRAYKLSLSLVSLSLLLPACNLFSIDPDEIDVADDEVGEEGFEVGDGDGDTAGNETGADTTTAADDAGTGTDTGTEEGTSDTSGDESSTTDGGTTSDNTSDGTSDTGPDVCGDFQTESECGICMTAVCCDEMLACEADAMCACANDCILSGLTQAECTELCGANEPTPAATDLASCALTNCPQECG